MYKYRATSYSHGAPASAGKPLQIEHFEASGRDEAKRIAERRLKVGAEGVIGVKVVR